MDNRLSSTCYELAPDSLFDGKFRIISKIGKGAFGSVYKATQERLGRIVALKLISPTITHEWESVERFSREARLLATLKHKNIPAVFEYKAVPSGFAYIAMEYCEGVNLRSKLDHTTRLHPEEFVSVFSQICKALESAHGAGVIHRDLTPANIIVLPDGTVKVIDFGLSKLLPTEGRDVQKLTQTGFLLGTPHYISPEQCKGEEATFLSDIYAVGCMMYEAAFGIKPFEADTPMGVIYKHGAEHPTFLLDRNNETGCRFLEIIKAAMRKEPSERIASASELHRHLSEAARTRSAKRINPAADKRRGAANRWLRFSARSATVFTTGLLLCAGLVSWIYVTAKNESNIYSSTRETDAEQLLYNQLYKDIFKNDRHAARLKLDQLKELFERHRFLVNAQTEARFKVAMADVAALDRNSVEAQQAREAAYEYIRLRRPQETNLQLRQARRLMELDMFRFETVKQEKAIMSQKLERLASDVLKLISILPRTEESGLALVEVGECCLLIHDQTKVNEIIKLLDAFRLGDASEQSIVQRHAAIFKAQVFFVRENLQLHRQQLLLALKVYPKEDRITITILQQLEQAERWLKLPAEAAKRTSAISRLTERLNKHQLPDHEDGLNERCRILLSVHS